MVMCYPHWRCTVTVFSKCLSHPYYPSPNIHLESTITQLFHGPCNISATFSCYTYIGVCDIFVDWRSFQLVDTVTVFPPLTLILTCRITCLPNVPLMPLPYRFLPPYPYTATLNPLKTHSDPQPQKSSLAVILIQYVRFGGLKSV